MREQWRHADDQLCRWAGGAANCRRGTGKFAHRRAGASRQAGLKLMKEGMLRRIDASFWCWFAGLIAVCLLPWNLLQDGLKAGNAMALFAADADSASAL